MNDPKRWSEDATAGELEHELLAAGQAVKLPESERRALWAGIALSVPAALTASTASAATTQAARGAFATYLTKGAIFLGAMGGLTWGATKLLAHPEPNVAERPLSVVTSAPHEAAATPAVSAAVAIPPPTSEHSAAPPINEPRPRATPASQLLEEGQAVLAARAALRSGDTGRCLRLLDQARERFARGALGQEREALAIEALGRSGQSAAARRRAQTFLQKYPQSPYSVDVRRFSE
ncbi:MAG TPA: hypothetical protein VHB79_29970 [Polyangiaceae bacterium]|nr:hypothetical protein [Polyangiaceae bacterium]